MEISALKIGRHVSCPPDRGDLGYNGKITHIGTVEDMNSLGRKFVWVEVQGPTHKSVWPSHRLG